LNERDASSSGAGFKNTNLLSTFSSTASILEGFKIRTNHSSFTRNVIELAKAPFLDIRKPSMNLTGKVEQLYDVVWLSLYARTRVIDNFFYVFVITIFGFGRF